MSTQSLPLIKNYIDRDLLEQIGSTCDLWVTVAPERMVLLVASRQTRQVVGLTTLESAEGQFFQKGLFELRSWFEGLELYTHEYRNTHIVFETPEYTLVPEVLFAPEKADVLIGSLFNLPKFYSIKNTRIEAHHCVAVFALPDIFCSTLKVLFPHASVHHYAEFLMEVSSEIGPNKTTICVNLHYEFMDVMHFDQQQLKFVNTFRFEADTDIIFYVLSVAEQQKISTQHLELTIAGDFNANDSLIQLLRKYVPHITVVKRNDSYSYPNSFREFQDQQFFSQLAPLFCG